jgi:hypothetical protein
MTNEQPLASVAALALALAAAATGFLVAGPHDLVGNQTEEGKRQQRSDDLFDMVSTTSTAFLGLTAGCARCHDHKFDPVAQKDFYALEAVFAGVEHGERPVRSGTSAEQRRAAQSGAACDCSPDRHRVKYASLLVLPRPGGHELTPWSDPCGRPTRGAARTASSAGPEVDGTGPATGTQVISSAGGGCPRIEETWR